MSRLLSIASFSLAVTASIGAAVAAEPSAATGDQIVVYGNRVQDADRVGSAVTLISAEDIELAQDAFVADALRRAPGIALARNGAYGGVASARIRGGSSGQTLVVIDGAVVNDAAAPQGGFNFGNLDVADVERIEILRGPQSLIWGADAIGGVIYIKTKREGAPLSAYAEGGSRATFRGGATAHGSIGATSLRATLSGVSSDGLSRASVGAEKDAYRTIGASLSAAAPLGERADARLTARFSDSRAELDGFPAPAFTFNDTAEREDTQDYAITARLAHRHGKRYDGALTLTASNIKRENFDAGAPTFDARGRRMGALYQGFLQISDRLLLAAGGEAERTRAIVSGVDEDASAGALYVMAEAEPLRRITISAGIRHDTFSNFDGETTARIAGAILLAEGADSQTRLRGSWGEGFRAPTLFELNFDQFGVTPNPDLRPERARGADIGVEQSFGAGGSRLRATYFRQRVRDQIDFDFAGNGYFNIDRVKSEGLEVEADIALGDIATIGGTYSLIDARDEMTGGRILRTPKHSGSASISLSPVGALSLSATAYFNGREEDFPAPNASFARLDVRASYDVSETLQVYGRVENAADADYEDVSGYAEPGASAFAGVRVRL
jgi:vitamin B12 transporter